MVTSINQKLNGTAAGKWHKSDCVIYCTHMYPLCTKIIGYINSEMFVILKLLESSNCYIFCTGKNPK